MADLRLNPDKLEGFLRRYRPDATVRDGVGGTSEFVMLCPFHDESRPSFHLNLHKGVGHCFSCKDKKSYTLQETVAALEGKSDSFAKSLLTQKGVYEKVKPETAREKQKRNEGCGISFEQIEKWQETLRLNAEQRAILVQTTDWTQETIDKFKIGFNGEMFTIPVIVNGAIVNVKYYHPNAAPKYRGEASHNKARLWPEEVVNKPGVLWIMEGEKDTILATQHGLNAMTFTTGAGHVAMEYLVKFKGRDVHIVYDQDPAGRSGAQQVADLLVRVCKSVKVVELPATDLPVGGDFTDFIKQKHTMVELAQAAEITESHKIKDSKTKVVISDEVYNTYLENLIPDGLFFKRVRMRVRVVSAAEGNTFLVPAETEASCTRSLGEHCNSCRLNFTDGEPLTLTMKPEYPEIMQLIDSDDTKQRTALKKLLEIYPKCPKVQLEFKSFQALFPIVLIPALERDKINHTYAMRTAWALNVPAETNEDYLAEAVTMANPGSQALTILCYKMDKDVSSIEEFELSEAAIKDLRVFQTGE